MADYRISKREYTKIDKNYPSLKSGYIIEVRFDMMGGWGKSNRFGVYDTIEEARNAFAEFKRFSQYADSEKITPVEDLKIV